jgi:hypothetical protein
MPLLEFDFSFSVERFRGDPTIEPRHLVGSLQQRLWTVSDPPPENLIPDNAQQGS